MHLCKSFRWGEERLHRSPKSLRWDEEPLYRSPRVRKFYTFLPAKHCKRGAGRKSKANVSGGTRNLYRSPKCFRWDEEPLYRSPRDSFKGLVEAGFWSCRKVHPVKG